MKFTNNEFIRFLFAGSVNTVATYLIYALLLRLFPYLVSYSVSYALGICLSYYLNSRFVFNTDLAVGRALRYPLVYVIQYVLGALLLYLLVEVLAIHKLFAPVLIILFTVPVTYFFSRLIIKGRSSSGARLQTSDCKELDHAMISDEDMADSSQSVDK